MTSWTEQSWLPRRGLGAVALVVGLLVRRSQQFYFAIATLAVTSIGTEVFRNWKAFTGPNGNRNGNQRTPRTKRGEAE